MRSVVGLGVVCALGVGLSGCFNAVADPDGASADEARAVAEALTRKVAFDNGNLREGSMPDANASDVRLYPLEETPSMSPGDVSLMALDVDNPDEVDDPVEATLVQFGRAARDHVEVGRGNKSAEPVSGEQPRLENRFTVDDDICETLCNKRHAVKLFEAARTLNGKVGRHQERTLVLDCSEHGSPDHCPNGNDDDPGTEPGGDIDPDGGSAGSGGLGEAGRGGAGGGPSGSGGSGGIDGNSGSGGTGGTAASDVPFAVQFPEVTDWAAIEIVYPQSHSASDGVHTFKLPLRARCLPVPLDGWVALPGGAVTFDTDPDNPGGVMATILKPDEDITIGVVDGTSGGTAPLSVTVGTDSQWSLGDTRFNTGADWMLNILTPTPPPPDTKCSVCHSETSSSGFDILVTPTQVARLSDAALMQILSTGTKPADVPFRVIPSDGIAFGGTTYTPTELYSMFHLWSASADQLTGMVLYLRSLTPSGEGCVVQGVTGQCEDVASNPSLECSQ